MTKAWIKGISGSIFKIYRLIFLFVIRMAFETWHPLLQILERCEKRYGKKYWVIFLMLILLGGTAACGKGNDGREVEDS